MRCIIVFVIYVVLSLSAAFAQAGNATRIDPARPAISSPQKISPALRGALYRVDYRGHTCYLFGTVHIGQTAFYPLEPQVMRALKNADKLVIEIDIRNAAAFQKALVQHGLYADGQTLDQHLSADSLASLKEALQRNGIAFENVARMKPWMVANLLLVQEMARSGFPAEQGLETYFLSVAEKQRKSVAELETADYQLSLFDKLNEAQQEDYLRENLHDLADGSAIKKTVALIDAWRHADGKKMEALMQEMLDDDSASSRFIEDVLLNQRNPGMADKVEALIKNDRAAFVAVGALHLLGDKGIPNLLKQRGYTVEKLY